MYMIASCYVFSISLFYCKCSSGAFRISNKLLKLLLLNIWDLISVELITKLEKRLLAWSKRKLTLTGRITVIKSLALSKFTHLFLFHYLWNSGQDRISRSNMIKNESCGGLRMVKLDNFIKAIKVTWVRRFLVNS